MPHKLYIIRQGDWVSKIAREYGIDDWKRIWNDPKNEELRKKRKNPNILYTGDELWIPNPDVHLIPTEAVKPGTKLVQLENPEQDKLMLRVLNPDDRPKAAVECQVSWNIGQPIKKMTDGNGILEVEIPAEATQCRIQVGAQVFDFSLGYLDPVDTVSGVQGRLKNLGYECPINGINGPETQAAVRNFQKEHGLPAADIPDPATEAKLEEVYGC